MEQKTDKRITKTKTQLKNAIYELLQKKNISAINVSELCKTAKINRNTFYVHYTIPEEVFYEAAYDILVPIFTDLERYSDPYDALVRIATFIKENRYACSILMSDNCEGKFNSLLMETAFSSSFEKMAKQVSPYPKRYHSMIANFNITGSFTIIREWLQTDMSDDPKEIASLIINLCYYGSKGRPNNA